MDFRILGPLEARDRGRPIELRGAKQRSLLAILLLRAGEVVSSDALIEAIWGEDVPRTARAALQNYVAQLRRSLGPGVIASHDGGYQLEVGPEQIDLGRFERLTAQSRDRDGDERVETLREALGLWRGRPLADLAYEPFAAREIPRLEELRTAALEDLVDAELALGAGPELVDELEALIAEHPFRERLRGQLMLALYRGGRQADALEAYQKTRRTLDEELGIEPSASLRALEQAILRQDASLEAITPSRTEERRQPEERRKTVTVLLVDLVFTETVDAELAHQAAGKELARIRELLESHGATTEQRAGDEVLAVFGVPVSHEDDALRAARAALELIDTEAGALQLRVGVETGEVLAGADEAGHGFVSGPAVTLAKRLLQQAGPGEILAGPMALQLGGDAIVAEPSGDGGRLLELVESTPALGRRLEVPLVGREAELARLRDAFSRAVDEHNCRLFLVLGEAGIGKTRLVSELFTELEAEATVLVGRCASYGKGATYLPVAEIVRETQARIALSDLLAGDEHAELIEARLDSLTGAGEASASGGETFWAVRRVLEALAAETAVVLVLEDLHWAEPTLLDLLEYLARRAAAPILLVGLSRPELLEARAEWSQNEAVTLGPLSVESGEALIENLGEFPIELRAQVLRTAGGNPFFIEQLLAHAIEGGEPETLPPTLDALLASRLDRLDAGELQVLQRAAVAGSELSREAVLHLLPSERTTAVEMRLEALVEKGMLREGQEAAARGRSFHFEHVLIRDAAYRTLPKAQRAQLHERLAGWIESHGTRAHELIGYHLEQAFECLAELGPVEEKERRLAADAGAYLAAGGLRAAKSGDMPAAFSLLTRASTLLEAAGAALRDLLTELGLVVWRSGEVESAERIFERAIRTALLERDRQAELRARTELAHLRLRRAEEGASEKLLSLASEAIPVFEELGDDHALGRVWFAVASTFGSYACQYRKSSEAAERALVHFRRSDWPLAPCLQALAAGLYYGPTPVPEAIRRCHALLEEADRGGEAHLLIFLAGLEAMADRLGSARAMAGQALAIYEDLAWTVNVVTNHAPLRAGIELLAGNFSEAERLLTESCETLEEWGLRTTLATHATQLAEALCGQERYADAVRASETAEKSSAGYDTGAQFLWRAVRGKALARLGEIDEGIRLTAEAVDLALSTDSVSQCAHALLCDAEALRLGGQMVKAAEAIERAIGLLEEKGNLAATRQAQALLVESQVPDRSSRSAEDPSGSSVR